MTIASAQPRVLAVETWSDNDQYPIDRKPIAVLASSDAACAAWLEMIMIFNDVRAAHGPRVMEITFRDEQGVMPQLAQELYDTAGRDHYDAWAEHLSLETGAVFPFDGVVVPPAWAIGTQTMTVSLQGVECVWIYDDADGSLHSHAITIDQLRALMLPH